MIAANRSSAGYDQLSPQATLRPPHDPVLRGVRVPWPPAARSGCTERLSRPTGPAWKARVAYRFSSRRRNRSGIMTQVSRLPSEKRRSADDAGLRAAYCAAACWSANSVKELMACAKSRPTEPKP